MDMLIAAVGGIPKEERGEEEIRRIGFLISECKEFVRMAAARQTETPGLIKMIA